MYDKYREEEVKRSTENNEHNEPFRSLELNDCLTTHHILSSQILNTVVVLTKTSHTLLNYRWFAVWSAVAGVEA